MKIVEQLRVLLAVRPREEPEKEEHFGKVGTVGIAQDLGAE